VGRAGIWLAAAVLLAGVLLLGMPRFEGEAPRIEAPEQVLLGAQPQRLEIEISDAGSGLRTSSVRLLHAGGSRSLHEEIYPGGWLQGGAPGGNRASIVLELSASELGLPDGAATLVLSVRDWSWRDGFDGNRNELSIPVVVDTRPPRLSLVSGLTYVQRGGSAAAVYRVDADAQRDGVRVGDFFFPGFPHPPAGEGGRVAIFAIPVDAPPRPSVDIVAFDAAANQARVGFPAQVLERSFAESPINLDEGFLSRVAVPLAAAAGLDAGNPIDAFRRVNAELRARNEAKIRELVSESSPQRLWSGPFEQMRNSKVMSRFAEHRTYLLQGQKISEARHFGFDLASTASAEVTASASGVVLFADDLGIYGNCVLIDHGLGLTTVYGHLSSFDVSAGQRVTQGQRIGQSGATGFAGGDHLHFAILVGGSYVDPVEWWDARWVRSHIEIRLEP